MAVALGQVRTSQDLWIEQGLFWCPCISYIVAWIPCYIQPPKLKVKVSKGWYILQKKGEESSTKK